MARALVLARVIEPVSKLDSLRVLHEAGVGPPSYATVKRCLPVFAEESWRQALAAACAEHAGLSPASLMLYDVSTRTSRPTPPTGSASQVIQTPAGPGRSPWVAHRSRRAVPLMANARSRAPRALLHAQARGRPRWLLDSRLQRRNNTGEASTSASWHAPIPVAPTRTLICR